MTELKRGVRKKVFLQKNGNRLILMTNECNSIEQGEIHDYTSRALVGRGSDKKRPLVHWAGTALLLPM